LREKGPESNCDAKDQGRKIPNEEILKIYIANKLEADPTSDIREYPICEIIQTPVKAGETCETASSPGFCYVSNSSEAKPLKSCQQAIVYASNTFTQTERFQGSTVDLQCISQQ
jgi:hypothetical protein